jgi:hypothetical protein
LKFKICRFRAKVEGSPTSENPKFQGCETSAKQLPANHHFEQKIHQYEV